MRKEIKGTKSQTWPILDFYRRETKGNFPKSADFLADLHKSESVEKTCRIIG